MNKNTARLWRRRLTLVLVAAGLVAVLVVGFRPVPVLVDAEPVTRGHLAVMVEEEGRTRVVDRYVVSAPLVAQARRVTLEPGSRVEAQQVLVTLDALPSPIPDIRSLAQARARVQAAEALLATAQQEAEAAEAAARFAQDDFGRLRRLAERNLAAEGEVERAEADARRTAALYRSAEFRVHTARAEVEAARAALAYVGGEDPEATGTIELRAPVSGQVLTRHFESARVVQPGEPILEIGDPGALEVEVDVLSADAVRIAAGMRVLFERWGEPEPLEGQVRRVEPRAFTKISALGVEEQRVWVIADIVSPPEQWIRLGDGYRVNARFILWEEDDALRVPTASLFRHVGGWALFVVEEGRAVLRPVEIGRRGAIHTQVLSGVRQGETVIVHPGRDVEDGVRVRLRA
jgi:HlyD family secretion protein